MADIGKEEQWKDGLVTGRSIGHQHGVHPAAFGFVPKAKRLGRQPRVIPSRDARGRGAGPPLETNIRQEGQIPLRQRDLIFRGMPLLVFGRLQVGSKLGNARDGKDLPGTAFLPETPNPGGCLGGMLSQLRILLANPGRRAKQIPPQQIRFGRCVALYLAEGLVVDPDLDYVRQVL